MQGIPIKDYLRETNLVHGRMIVLVGLLSGLFFVLLTRSWYLQIYQFDRFAVLSADNRVRLLAEPPVRGQIFDRQGRVLAENIPMFTLEITPGEVSDMDELLNEIAKIVHLTPNEVRKFKSLVHSRPDFESQILKVKLSEDEVARLMVNQFRLPGAQVKARLQRHYPYGAELVHVLGYVGRINQADLAKIDKTRYQGTDYIGKLGIELRYESELLGKVGVKQVEINAHGRVVQVLERQPPVSGIDIYLNIDAELQIKAREYLNGKRGSVIAIEPDTGAVLAFVSNPVYDPNLFVNGISHRQYNALRDDINRPLLNRALNGRYAPGSTIKGLISMAGLEHGWQPEKQVVCRGFYQLKGSSHRYRCWHKAGHGAMSMVDAIVQSCDVYFYSLASALGIDRIHAFLSKFGLGQRTGIDLLGEPSGLVPSRAWKKRVKQQPWYPGETVITGIGQGYLLTTPLQLAVMTATLANRGQSVQPRLVNRLVQDGDNIPLQVDNNRVARVEVSDKHIDDIVKAMQLVVADPQGTAYALTHNLQYDFAGKTGTAQVVGIGQGEQYDESKLSDFEKDHALFIAFAPTEKPEIALAVIVENGGSGGRAAAPIARKLMDYYLLGLTPENKDILRGSEREPAT